MLCFRNLMNRSKMHINTYSGAEQVRMFLRAGLRHDEPAVQGAEGGAGLRLLVWVWRGLKESCKHYLKTFISSFASLWNEQMYGQWPGSILGHVSDWKEVSISPSLFLSRSRTCPFAQLKTCCGSGCFGRIPNSFSFSICWSKVLLYSFHLLILLTFFVKRKK